MKRLLVFVLFAMMIGVSVAIAEDAAGSIASGETEAADTTLLRIPSSVWVIWVGGSSVRFRSSIRFHDKVDDWGCFIDPEGELGRWDCS